MKKWTNPEIAELSIEATAHGWTGIYRDGGYIGDGQVSGHLKWTNGSEQPANPADPEPSEPVDSLS